MGFIKKHFVFFFASVICLLLFFAGNASVYPEFLVPAFEGIMSFTDYIIKAFNLEEVAAFLFSLPSFLLMGGYLLLRYFLGFTALLFSKGDMEQGAMILVISPMKVIKYGIMIYLSVDFILLLLLVSVIGSPLAGLIFLASRIFLLLGYVPLAVFVGYAIGDALKIRGYTLLYYFLGAFACSVCCFVSVLGRSFFLFVFPVISYGTIYMLLLNKYKTGNSHSVIFKTSRADKDFERERLYSVIVKDVDFSDVEDKNE